MSTESQGFNPYQAVIADLRAKRDQIDGLIQQLEAFNAGTAAPGAALQSTGSPVPNEGPGAFLGMSIADAAVKLLAVRKRPLTNPEITEAIIAGGVHMVSKEPVNTVGSILHRRSTQVQDIVRVGKTWGLADWYPNKGRFNTKKNGTKGDAEASGEASEASPGEPTAPERP